MPLLNASASTANLVYQVSLIVLVAAAALVLLSAVGLVWSTSIRERDLNERLARVGDARAQADAEVLKAKEEVAAAHQQVVEATTAAANMEKEITAAQQTPGNPPPVAGGRQVTVENCGPVINYVKTVSKGRIIVEAIASNAEAAQFAKQVSAMLTSAGYDVTENFGSTTLLGDEPVACR